MTEQGPTRPRSRLDGARASRTVFLTAILLLVIVSMGLVVVSPLALSALDDGDIDWNRLSNIGETYGAVSAVVAAVALLGVAVSLGIQSREASAARKNARRAHHVELMRMAMADPRYMECWGPYVAGSFDAESQFTYVNLVVAHWYAEHQIGEMSDPLLRATAASVFASAPGRHYWQHTGTFWRDNYSGRRAKRFYRVLEETYQEAIRKPPSPAPASAPPERPVPVSRRSRPVGFAVAGAAVATALVVVRALRHALRRR